MMIIAIPIRLRSEANLREHWRTQARRATTQRAVTTMMLRASGRVPSTFPLDVVIVRLIGPRGRVMDTDNLVISAKHVRDAIAAWLGIDDRHDDVVSYSVRQEKAGKHGVRVEIRRREPAKGVA